MTNQEVYNYNISSSPHVRNKISTGSVMYDVFIALMPVSFIGVWRFGFHALLVILMSIASAVLTEFVFDYITGKENTIRDGSAVVTGLLLALCLPAGVALYIPYIGAVFAILIVKCLFGGLGKNFINPALAGRCFLLLSFGGSMTKYTIDGVTSATPLAKLASEGSLSANYIVKMFTGHAGGVIGCSAFALLIGGLYLWVVDGITWQIPVSIITSFAVFMAIFNPENLNLGNLIAHIAGGGLLMAAFFMATDPVTSPVTGTGQIIYGVCVGFLSALFRTYGASADSVSYAVILSNLITPLIDEYIIPKPFGYRADAMDGKGIFELDNNLNNNQSGWLSNLLSKSYGNFIFLGSGIFIGCVILYSVSILTGGALEAQKLSANLEIYQAVLPDIDKNNINIHEISEIAVADFDGVVYGADFGNVYINQAVTAEDGENNLIGHVISVTSADGNDGNITLSVGVLPDGSIHAIYFTELNETPGLGMRAAEPEFISQFSGLYGHITLGEDIDALSGATVTSRAVVNAVNAALDFYNTQITQINADGEG